MEPPSEEEIQNILQVIRDHNPKFVERVEQAVKKDPRHVQQMIQSKPWLRSMLHAYQTDREGYELRLTDYRLSKETTELAANYRRVKDKEGADQERKELREQITEVVGKHYDVRRVLRLRMMSRIEDKLGEMKAQLEERDKNADQVKRDRIKQLVGEPDALQW